MIICNMFREVEAEIVEFENDVATFEKGHWMKKMNQKLAIVEEEMKLSILPKLRLEVSRIKQSNAQQKAEYYAIHPYQALVNSPGKIAMWSGVAILVVAIVGAQFVKIKK